MKAVELVEVWSHHVDIDQCCTYRINRKGQRRFHNLITVVCTAEYDGAECVARAKAAT